jgi:predicted nucleic acid-binding protein
VALTVLDASVVIAFRDPADSLHRRAVAAFRTHAADHLILPASAYAEVLVGPVRHGPATVASLEAFIRDFAMHIAPLTAEIARQAASLRASYASLRLPDAIVLATGDVVDATVVLTGDATWPRLNARARLI